MGDDVGAVAPAGGDARPGGGEPRVERFEGRTDRGARIVEATPVPAQKIGLGVAAVGAAGHFIGLGQTGVEPASEGVSCRSLEHGPGVIVAQIGVGGGQVLTRAVGPALRVSRAGDGDQGERRSGGEKRLHGMGLRFLHWARSRASRERGVVKPDHGSACKVRIGRRGKLARV